ncbi:MAG: hypothetical protein WCC46_10865, partial [Terriglobales bacterium]
MPNVNYSENRQGHAGLQSQHLQRSLRPLGQPLDREESDDQELSGHQYLEEVRCGALVGLRHQLTLEKHDKERGEKPGGNQQGDEAARAFQQLQHASLDSTKAFGETTLFHIDRI